MTNEPKISRVKQTFWLAGGRILAMLVTFVLPFFLTRILSKNEYGIYAQFNTVSQFITAIFAFGFPASLYYFFPSSPTDRHRALLGNIFLASTAGSWLACLLLMIPPIGKLITGGGEFYNYLPFLCLSIVLFIPTGLMEPFYVVRKDLKLSAWYPSAIILVKVLSVILSAMLIPGVKGVLCGVIAMDIFVYIYTLTYCLKHTRKNRKAPFFDLSLLKKQIRYTLPFGLAVLFNTISSKLDKMLCINFMTAAEYAAYTIAFFGIPGIQQIYTSLGNIYLIDMTRAAAAKDDHQLLNLFHDMTTRTFALTVPTVLIVCLYAEEIITFIFTAKYLDAVGYFRVYIFCLVELMLGTSLIIRASGQTGYSLYSYAIAAIFTLPGTYFAVKYYGALGGIASAAAAQIMPKLLQAYFEIKILKTSFSRYLPWKNFFKIASVSLILLIPFYLLHGFMRFNVFISSGLAGMYLLAVFFCNLKMDVGLIDKPSMIKYLSRFHLHFINSIIR